jgi:hypothetical protein
LFHLIQEFPPKSKLDTKQFGDHTSTITKEQLEPNLGGVTVEQVITQFYTTINACFLEKLFIFIQMEHGD